MRKNILMVTGDSGIAFGKQNIFYEMLKEFSKYFATIHVITMGNGEGKSFVIHENVHIHPSNRSRVLRMDFFNHSNFVYQKALEIHKHHPLSFVISHVVPPFNPFTLGGEKVAKYLNIQHFAEVMHIPGYPKAYNFMEFWEKHSMNRFLKSRHHRYSAIRIVNQRELHPYLKRMAVPEEKILHIPAFYLDFQTFRPMQNEARDPYQFVYAGRFETNKNIYSLLKAMMELRKDHPKVKLKMVGEGTLSKQIKRWIERNNLSDCVEILGWLPTQKDVAKVYARSQALVMPSFSEGGPRVTLEAMACETLVLSTPVGIMSEVIRDGENALQIAWNAEDIESKMRWVLEHPHEAHDLARQGRVSIRPFEYHHAIKNYAQTYLKQIS